MCFKTFKNYALNKLDDKSNNEEDYSNENTPDSNKLSSSI